MKHKYTTFALLLIPFILLLPSCETDTNLLSSPTNTAKAVIQAVLDVDPDLLQSTFSQNMIDEEMDRWDTQGATMDLYSWREEILSDIGRTATIDHFTFESITYDIMETLEPMGQYGSICRSYYDSEYDEYLFIDHIRYVRVFFNNMELFRFTVINESASWKLESIRPVC